MKTIGLLGGMTWESTLEYYRIINEEVKARLGGFHSAKCLLYSVDFAQIERLQRLDAWAELTGLMVDAASTLKQAGADFLVICTNTLHRTAAAIEEQSGLPVLHIARATGDAIVRQGLRKVGLLGTKYTMQGGFLQGILADEYGVEVLLPTETEMETVHRVIFDELCHGVIRTESKAKYVRIIGELAGRGAQGVILGCTEIPLLIKPEDVGIPVFNTTYLHAAAAVDAALAD
ncbi:MAG: aspartate/glutamate racemase family protein [Firmicutes bacterium]|nr:aspartate/glutamate racemase family protein [Bacillota bacterium]